MEDNLKGCRPQPVSKKNSGAAISPVMKSSLRNLALAGAFATLASPLLLAQNTTADVVGTVTDATGAAIPNATVTLVAN